MLQQAQAFSSFSINDVDEARRFYGETLGLEISGVPKMPDMLDLRLAGGVRIALYMKGDHTPATFTVLNFKVPNVEETVSQLTSRGVRFEIYTDGPVRTDERGIFRGDGPTIAWFTDPAGNILSVLEET